MDQIAGLEQQGVHEDDHAGDPVETYYALCNMYVKIQKEIECVCRYLYIYVYVYRLI